MIKKISVIETSSKDDFLYQELMELLWDHKLLRGGAALNQTLKDHNVLTLYLISKQIDKIRNIEESYFNDDGSLKSDIIDKTFVERQHHLASLHSLFNNI
ncbi:hypothetical protein IJI28_01020 [Candidatus Saccharibacteria bacterium]|nr:hypothetical protein [Candidatus Saccharibacteria bacterium]